MRWLFAAFAALVGCHAARVAPEPPRAFRFLHVSDLHFTEANDEKSNAAKIAALLPEIERSKPALLFATGDITEMGTPAEYARMRATIGSLPMFFAPGNHDVRWNPLGKEGYVLGTGGALYASKDVQGVHFVTFDSTVLLEHWGHFDQKELEWLSADLGRLPKDTPIVIGFHHWIGHVPTMVDNEEDFLKVIEPYNVRLLLVGHGHQDLFWSTNGIATLEEQGLYQGGYSVVDVGQNDLTIHRRNGALVATIPLRRSRVPRWSAAIEGSEVRADKGELPPATKLAYRLDQGAYVAITTPIAVREPGLHTVTVQAELPDGRAYQRPLRYDVPRNDGPPPDWTVQLDGAVQSRLVRDGDALYATTMSGTLYALDAATGHTRWTVHTDGPILATPHVEGGRVYIGSVDHHLYAIDVATGKEAWRFRTDASILGSATVARGVVGVASTDRHIYGVDLQTGARRWTSPAPGMIQSKAATDGERFYFGGWDNAVRAVDVATGKVVWETKVGKNKDGKLAVPFSPAISAPVLANDKLYIASNDGVLHALSTADGTIVWEVTQKAIGYNTPLFLDGTIFTGSLDAGNAIAVDARTGERRWASTTGFETYDSSFVTARGMLFIGSVAGVVSALDPKNGSVVWQYRLGPGHMLSTPAVDDARLYASSMQGRIVALPIR